MGAWVDHERQVIHLHQQYLTILGQRSLACDLPSHDRLLELRAVNGWLDYLLLQLRTDAATEAGHA